MSNLPLAITESIIAWYRFAARELPWRTDTATAWGILVSEIMLQQTQVDRVLPIWQQWLERWPTPAALAAAPAHEVLVAWGRLGYPRRALRLHESAKAITTEHGGVVPDDLDTLLALPGIGEYTARAVAVFAHSKRHPVVDTNVRRVIARIRNGQGQAGPPRTRQDLAETSEFLPQDAAKAREASYALMEFGAVLCTSGAPRCGDCPVREQCAWAGAGFPAYGGPVAAKQKPYQGSLREARGSILAQLRARPEQLHSAAELLDSNDPERWLRALESLLRDGLIVAETSAATESAGEAEAELQYRLP